MKEYRNRKTNGNANERVNGILNKQSNRTLNGSEVAKFDEMQLEQLILSAEQDLVQAPPDLEMEVLDRIEEKLKPETDLLKSGAELLKRDLNQSPKHLKRTGEHPKRTGGKREFYRYCVRVGSAVAAAIAILLILPFFTERSESPVARMNASKSAMRVEERNVEEKRERILKDMDIHDNRMDLFRIDLIK